MGCGRAATNTSTAGSPTKYLLRYMFKLQRRRISSSSNVGERVTHAERRIEVKKDGERECVYVNSEQLPNLETGDEVEFYINIWGCDSSFDDEAEQATKLFGQTKKTSDQTNGSTSISENDLVNKVAPNSCEDIPAEGPMLNCD